MGNPSRDTIVSVILLMFCGFLIWAGFLIRDPQFGELSPAAWPKGVTYVLTAFCVVFFVQSVLADRARAPDEPAAEPEREAGLIGWVRHFFNPIVCFAMYFAFLLTLPFFGTLIGGTLLVFALLSFLGGVSPRLLFMHAVIAIISVGAMWSLFTFGLRVLLPRGEIIPGI
ncbi:MAG: tripartite tricarboxylate transporter TctB family protein [Pseudomonadota bacterium]